ncbi:MAG: PDDEXK nuclease domain-containing protein [Planctomycetota bacterium]|nr:PDDEXK nuclease domain-containing protein [Planctomycetota bacterium]
MAKKKRKKTELKTNDDRYSDVLASMVDLLESARRASARAVNCVMTATYWEIGRRIVELEQGGGDRAGYGEELIPQLSHDLTRRFGRGFGVVNLSYMRRFYVCWPAEQIFQTVSEKSSYPKSQTLSEILATVSPISDSPISPTVLAKSQTPSDTDFTVLETAACFPLPWSHYVKLLSVDDENARRFYEEEALRGGWSVRQLNRQSNSLFYERTLLSTNKAAMLRKGSEPTADDFVTPEEEIKDPLVLEFLDLKDEYSENELEDALIHHLEQFLLELGSDFTFVGRQRRLRIGNEWYRVDLLFFHRRLRCLVVIDLKIGKFNHDDAGQMHMYLNYAAEHWTNQGENPPVGLILSRISHHIGKC